MKSVFPFVLLFTFQLYSQSLYFPPSIGNSWETISLHQLNWCDDETEALYQSLERNNSKAFILLKDGKIVLEKYFGAFTADSLWYWASAGKSLTSFLIGIAQEENYLNIQDKTSKYLEEGWTSCPIEKENLITIQHQLSMTSGLSDLVPDPYCTNTSCLEYLKDAGTRWAYHNAPYTLLDKVIEKASGQNLNSFVISRLSAKTGIYGSFIKSGFNNVFISKPRVMARYGLLVLAKGNWNGNQILRDSQYFNQMVSSSQVINPSYGYLWWLNGKSSYKVPGLQLVIPGPLSKEAPRDMFCALGKNGQIINVVPSQNLVWIRMGNALENGEVPFTLNDTVWSYLHKIICTPTKTLDEKYTNIGMKIIQDQTNGQIKLLNIPVDCKLVVYSTSGQVIFHTNLTENECLLPRIPKGFYVIQLIHSNMPNVVKKMLVN